MSETFLLFSPSMIFVVLGTLCLRGKYKATGAVSFICALLSALLMLEAMQGSEFAGLYMIGALIYSLAYGLSFVGIVALIERIIKFLSRNKNSNQQVDPIVTTPVDEVEPQSTQGHP